MKHHANAKKSVSQELVEESILGDPKTMVESAEHIAGLLTVDASKTQVRNIFGTLKRMEMKGFDIRKFVLLKPKMHYIWSRKKGLAPLKEVVDYGVDVVCKSENPEESFKRFCEFFEAILAYHRAKKS